MKEVSMNNECLIVIDAQEWILNLPLKPNSSYQIVPAISSRVEMARAAGKKIIWIQYRRLDNSDGGSLGKARIHTRCGYRQSDQIIEKYGIDAFQQTTLHTELQRLGIGKILLIGLMTSHAIKETAIAAANIGYSVQVDSQACAALSLPDHKLALDQMQANHNIEILG
ncbi:cysteine hydrolase family protein [Corynebacterium suicordis]